MPFRRRSVTVLSQLKWPVQGRQHAPPRLHDTNARRRRQTVRIAKFGA